MFDLPIVPIPQPSTLICLHGGRRNWNHAPYKILLDTMHSGTLIGHLLPCSVEQNICSSWPPSFMSVESTCCPFIVLGALKQVKWRTLRKKLSKCFCQGCPLQSAKVQCGARMPVADADMKLASQSCWAGAGLT